MIRRSPTRIELKLEDLADFEYIQKFDKKKAPNAVPGTVGGISAADAQKFMRQDRIGFRPIRGGAPTASSGSAAGASGTAGGNAGVMTPASVDAMSGVLTVEASTTTVDAQGSDGGATVGTGSTTTTTTGVGTNNRSNNLADMDTSGEDPDAVAPSTFNVESNNASNVDMSLDESL